MGSYFSSCFHRKPKRVKSQLPGNQFQVRQPDEAPLDIDLVQADKIQNRDHIPTTNAQVESSTSQKQKETPESALSAQSLSHGEEPVGSLKSGSASVAPMPSVTKPNSGSADLQTGPETEQQHSTASVVFLNEDEPYATVNDHSSKPATKSETAEWKERKDWSSILNIPKMKFESLVRSVLIETTGSIIEKCAVFEKRQGAYHLVVIVGVIRERSIERYVVRVPAQGVEALWTEEDKAVLRGEVDLLQQIHYTTNVPVSKVIAYNEELRHLNPDQDLGVPWMLIQFLPGKDAYDIWYDQPYKHNTAYLAADVPSPETHRKRVNFLTSLANYMVELQKLEFDAIGMPKIHIPCGVQKSGKDQDYVAMVGSTFHWPYVNDIQAVVRRGPFEFTQAYIRPQWKHWYGDLCRNEDSFHPDEDDEPRTIEELKSIGIGEILRMVFNTIAFNIPTETFTIHHNDLDLQNILTDSDGFVTGIIDWDGAYAAPRCIGATAVPKWLMHDWFPPRAHTHCLGSRPHMAWSTEYYRNIYAAAIYAAELKNGLAPDAQYTSKSPIYLSALSALYEGGHDQDFAEKILRRIPNLSADTDGFMILLGHGWPAAEKMLQEEIVKLCEPELPAVDLLRDLGFDVVGLGLVEEEEYKAHAGANEGWWDSQHTPKKLEQMHEQNHEQNPKQNPKQNPTPNEHHTLIQTLLSVDPTNMHAFLAQNIDNLLKIPSWNLVLGLDVPPTQ